MPDHAGRTHTLNGYRRGDWYKPILRELRRHGIDDNVWALNRQIEWHLGKLRELGGWHWLCLIMEE